MWIVFVKMLPGHTMIVIVNTFIQDIYKYMPEKKLHVFRVYTVASVLLLDSVCYFP